jgi:pyrroline-5-carboxylate reductase
VRAYTAPMTVRAATTVTVTRSILEVNAWMRGFASHPVHILTLVEERPTVAVMGVGAMGGALVTGLLDAGWPPSDLTLVEQRTDRLHELIELTGCHGFSDPESGIDGQDVIVLAVKPQGIHEALAALAGRVGSDQVVVALVAGVPLSVYERVLGEVPMIRTMPNTPALIREGVTGMAPGPHARPVHVERARAVLAAVGRVEEVTEEQIDAVTAISGSGPAYVFLLAESLMAAAMEQGLAPETADGLVRQLIKGAGALLAGSELGPDELRVQVTSPGGTTAAALGVFEAGGFRELVSDAVEAAAVRSRELGAAAADESN